MRIDLPLCDFLKCRKRFDGKCVYIGYETCEYKLMKEKENKYRWHDLRKNPDDLPTVKTNMHIIFKSGGQALVTFFPNAKYKYSSICHGDEEEGYVNFTDVIAWREIE